jgi:hypothetical protein
MVFWESPPDLADQPPDNRDFAEIWQGADKIVYSKTLQFGIERQNPDQRDFVSETALVARASSGTLRPSVWGESGVHIVDIGELCSP